MVVRARSLRAAVLVLALALAGCTTPSTAPPAPARAIAASPAGAAASPGTAASSSAAASPSIAACAPVAGKDFPPLLSGFDPRLATAPADNGALTDPKYLSVTVLIQGTCAKVASGQRVTLNYVGLTLADGKVFDSSWERNQAFEVEIGKGVLIQGFERGLIGVAVGSRIQLDMPADLAYGDNPPSGAPKGALRFIVDVLNAQA
ncbi:FKBP-type peptidyl-prolyl cis-trans isomerase [Dactylosporangium sp. NPDC051541]|uniref:FKBP-type peptidyl-prolyl cis-trans isomerase n=1 Tax=Dactylosporangium sp. NPDC051541 TaxID=3363977 RepID=UPI00378C8FED